LRQAIVFTLSFGVSYLVYEYVHYLNHVEPPKTLYGRWARKHHFLHHFEDAKSNHGVTSPLWDLVFGTYRRLPKIRVPKRFEMRWLLDENAEIRGEYRDDYVLR
jgi:sterol desaturase/sphingolipid hydroxylase (fatty acid hydroxylase superfamily)